MLDPVGRRTGGEVLHTFRTESARPLPTGRTAHRVRLTTIEACDTREPNLGICRGITPRRREGQPCSARATPCSHALQPCSFCCAWPRPYRPHRRYPPH